MADLKNFGDQLKKDLTNKAVESAKSEVGDVMKGESIKDSAKDVATDVANEAASKVKGLFGKDKQ